MSDNQALTFGPVNSRRFGISLGIDLSPTFKQCNFDCLYCELDKAKTMSKQTDSIAVEKYISAVKEALLKYKETEVITITANGEPTMYPYLNELVDELNKIKEKRKLLILSNAGLIDNIEVVNALKKIDIVKLSLDCVSKECFKKLDRLDETINHDDIINGLIKFSKEFKNDLVMEVLFVDTMNNKTNEITKIHSVLKELNPKRVDIGTIDRPPAYDVKAISYDELKDISLIMNDLNISIAHKDKVKLNKNLSKDEILNLLDKRPQTSDDIDNLLNESSKTLFNKLVDESKIISIDQAGVLFYGRNKS